MLIRQIQRGDAEQLLHLKLQSVCRRVYDGEVDLIPIQM